MNNKKGFIIFSVIVVAFVVLMALALDLKTLNSSEDSNNTDTNETTINSNELGAKNNPYVLDANTWFSEYIKDSSQNTYTNKWVKVSGTVLWISETRSSIGYVLAGGKTSALTCWVDGHDVDAQFGQYVEYIGLVKEEDSNTITLIDGHIVSSKWPESKPESPVTISDWSASRDSAGGVEWNFKFTNNTDKTIKYIYMSWDCYNAVGDLVYDQITNESNKSIKYTGPLEPGKSTNILRNTTRFYNYSYNTAALTKLHVEFMDGTIIWVATNGYENVIVN